MAVAERGMRVLLSGSSGSIGRRLMAAMREDGATVVPLVRGAQAPGRVVWWDPEQGILSPADVTAFDAVVHLAGEPVGSGRWTADKKARIYGSRVRGTELLAGALASAAQPPGVFLCASGINFYGERGDEVLGETEPRGAGFLAEVCEAWEASTAPLQGVARVSSMRIGAVLSPDGGMLAQLLPLFRMGMGGAIAGGAAYVSWVTLEDAVRAMQYLLAADDLGGPVNVVAPWPVTNREFTHALAAALHRPAPLPVPGWAVRALFGQFGEETVLSSVRARPARLLADGFVFAQPRIEPALRSMLARDV